MAGAFDVITNALKVAYPPKAIDAMVNEDTVFRKALKKNLPAGARVTGGILKFGANFSPPANYGQTKDGGALVTPIDRTEAQFTLTPTMFDGGFEIGWITKKAARDAKHAFNGGELRRRTEETISGLAKFIERTLVGTWGSGCMATIGTAVTTQAYFYAKKPLGALLLEENQRISVRTTADGGALVSTVADDMDMLRITKIVRTPTLDTVTVVNAAEGTPSLTSVEDQWLYVVSGLAESIAPTFTSDGASFRANGLRGLVDDATYSAFLHGLSRTTYPKLKANVESNGGTLRNLTEQILVHAVHNVRHRVGKRPTDIWTNTGQVEKYIEFVAPDRRYNVNGSGIQGMGTGYKEDSLVHYAPGLALKFNISLDICPREMYILNWDTFFHYVAADMEWWDEGEMLKPKPATTTYAASYLAFIHSIENIGCDMPLANTVIRDLKDPLCGDA